MNPAVQTDRETRRTQVIESLADAVATLERAPPVHIAVDGLTDPVTRTLADDLARLLAPRGRRCRRVTLDTLSLLHPAGPGVARPSHRGGPGDDLVVVDGCFLQHPEFLGAWDLVIFYVPARHNPPDPTRTPTKPRPPPGTSPRSTPRTSPTSWSTSTTRAGR